MIVTVKDAAQKLCPNKIGTCRASECMAWRWVEDTICEMLAEKVQDMLRTPAENVRPHMRRGYCGLAGRPHFQ